MSSVKLNLFQRLLLELLWFIARAVAILPHWFRYHVLARGVYLLLYRVFRYRMRVVRENLANALPERSESERRQIARDFYLILSEIIVSTLSLANRNSEKGTIIGEDGKDAYYLFNTSYNQDINEIVLTAHFGLWEYMLFAFKHSERYALAVYHALENPTFDAFLKRLRSHKNVVLLPISEATRYCVKYRHGVDGVPYSLGLLADQSPPRRANAKWYTFLNQDTQFYDGGEKLALKLGMPVAFSYFKRLGAGRYQFVFEYIYDGKESVEEGYITARYVEILERVIRENPHMWLWSHRRWKRKKVA